MSLEKAQIRAAMAHDLGCRLDDQVEAAKREVVRSEAANQAFLQGQRAVEGLFQHVDKDVDEGQLDLPQAEIAKKWVRRAAGLLISMSQTAANGILIAKGAVSMAERTVKITKDAYDFETNKASGMREQPGAVVGVEHVDGTVTGQVVPITKGQRPVGAHPGMSIGMRRRLEDAATARLAEPAQVEQTPVVEKKLVKRGRPKKA